MKTRKTILFLLLLSFVVPKAFSQDISTEGTDFWVSFMGNGFDTNDNGGDPYLKTQVLLSSLHDCSGVISNPSTGWSESFTIEANNVIFIDIPEEQAYLGCNNYTSPLNKSLHIVTDQPVSAYCANAARFSFDASYILPTPALADDYIIQTFDQSSSTNEHTSAFFIIAVDEGVTTVDITPTVKTLDGKPANQQYSISLQQGQVYQVRSHNTSSFFGGSSRDLSGSRVTAHDCKKIAVFNGSTLTMVPTSGSDSDCIFEQAMPVQAWGKKFVVTSSLGREKKDYVKITSASDNNEITINGQYYATLSANESKSFQMQETSYFVETSSRCAVYLYNHSKDGSPSSSHGTGAPSMVWIAPVEQRINELAFNTFNDEDPDHVSVDLHYVNIIVESDDAGNVILDGNPIPESQFVAVAGNSSYMFFRQEISHGAHHLTCEGGFNAHVYGFGNATGYAYMVGSKAADLSTSIIVNEEIVNPYDTITNCALEEISFLADINLIDYNLEWDFGDGSTSNDNPATHQYNGNELYEAALTVTTEEPPCGGTSTTNTSYFYIDSRRDPDREITDTICFRGPDTYNENGFELHYESPGLYHDIDTIINESGCESYLRLNLSVSDLIDAEPEVEDGYCDSFEWHGKTYTSSGHYSDTIPDSTGCYTVHHLNLELQYSPHPTEIYPTDTSNHAPHWVVTATEFQINSYEFTIHDSIPGNELLWDFVRWEIEDPSVQWILEPDATTTPIGKKCRIYVLNYAEDTVWIRATPFNSCDTIGKKSQLYWFVSSFYGIDDDDSSAGSATFDLNISPNPNNGEMEIQFGEIGGLIEATVYDMRGQTIDRFSLEGIPRSRHSYTLKNVNNGIYLFVFNYNGHHITKKIIITN